LKKKHNYNWFDNEQFDFYITHHERHQCEKKIIWWIYKLKLRAAPTYKFVTNFKTFNLSKVFLIWNNQNFSEWKDKYNLDDFGGFSSRTNTEAAIRMVLA
jgi:hypothetical protein